MNFRDLFRIRAFVWLSGGLLLLALGLVAERTRPYPNLTEILSAPQKIDGLPIALIVECRVAEITHDGFILKQMDKQIFARGPERNFQIGDDIAVEGIFLTPDTLEVTRLHVSLNRRLKIAVSILPVLVVGFLLWRNVGLDRKRGWLYLKKSFHA
jgi:hypothetical protein